MTIGLCNWFRRVAQLRACRSPAAPRVQLEILEPRVLLSADCGAGASGLPIGRFAEAALMEDVQSEAVPVGAGAVAPSLPGLELTNADASRLRGQIVYLDFDGAEDVVYEGPVTVGPFTVPAFAAPRRLAGAEGKIEAEVCAGLRRMFAEAGVIFTLQPPAGERPCSTVYIGGKDAAFAACGSFDGLAEAVDIGNCNACDEALVFSDKLGAGASDPMRYMARLIGVIAHEVGHLLGYGHAGPTTPARRGGNGGGPLDAVAHATGPDDDQTAEMNGPVHQWLTYNAFLFYDSQFAGSELGAFLGDWQDCGRRHHRTNGDDNDVIEGVFDEDVSGPIFYPFDNGFHRDITPQNPLGQSVPYEQHFVAGAEGGEIYAGWNGFASAVTQALSYWQTYVLETYPLNAALSYYYLGHVAHLLEDMTVPAHVHNDAHPFRDAYEYTMGEHSNYLLWGCGAGVRVAPVNPIMIPADLVSLFRETIDYTEEYPSDDAAGENGPEIPDLGLHRPDLVSRSGGFRGDGAVLSASSSNEIAILADDLMVWAMEKTAELFRLFYSLVDTTAPIVSLATSFGADEAGAVLKPDRFHIAARAHDDLSGCDADGFRFRIERKSGGVWEPVAVSPNGGEFEFLAPGDGLYRISVEVSDAARHLGRSETGYFRVEQASGLAPVYRFWSPVFSRHFYTIRAGERDKLLNNATAFWTYEGIAFWAFAGETQAGVTPVYRFWSDTLRAHFYTTSAAEKTKLTDDPLSPWTFEGIAFYAYPRGAEPPGTSAVHRFWSARLGCHFFTIRPAERDKLLNLLPLVWTYEAVAWYAYDP